MHRLVQIAIYISVCYLFGSIQFGYLLAKIFLKKEVTKIGSGSTGTTNVLRLGNKTIGFATLICDILKGFLPACLMYKVCGVRGGVYYASLFACLIGHIFPVFFGFKGGKGVATMFGIFIFISPLVALVSVVLYITILIIFRISFVASLAMCTCFTVVELSLCGCDKNCQVFLCAALLTVFFSHRKNICGFVRKNKNA